MKPGTSSNLVNCKYATKDISIQHEQSVDMLRDCIMIHDDVFTLPVFYTVADIHCIILYICSLGWVLLLVCSLYVCLSVYLSMPTVCMSFIIIIII